MHPDPFRVILADPPWMFRDRLPGSKRGAAKHYNALRTSDIMRFPLPPIADDAWLFLWRTHTHQREAMQVMEAWGFRYASEIVWVKVSKNGRPLLGMGHTVRQSHEVCIVGRRGRPKQRTKAIGSVILAPRRLHSVKPTHMYDLIEAFTPGPYLELFARARRPGWHSIGDQLEEAHDV